MSNSHSSALMIGVSGIRGVIGTGFAASLHLTALRALRDLLGDDWPQSPVNRVPAHQRDKG